MQRFDQALPDSVFRPPQPATHPKLDRPGLDYNQTCRPLRTGTETPWYQRLLLAIGALCVLNLAACSTPMGAPNLQGKPLSGYVEMSQVQAAYIGSGSAGHGTLRFRGSTYPFNVGGLGVGGIGISSNRGTGRCLRAPAPQRLPGRIRAGPLWLRPGHYQRGGPVVAERTWRDHAPERQAERVDAEFGRRCCRDHYEPVTASYR